VLFIGPEKQRTSGQRAYVRWFLPSGSMAASYVQVLSKGYSKSSVHSVVPCISPVQFAKRMSGCPPRTPELQTTAYVC
jgi:hypothetical protein